MNEDRYSELFDIPCYMFDCRERLRPASFFDIAQELAAKGSAQLHITDQELASIGLVWILARMTVRFDSLPKRLDTVTAQTWHRGMEGLTFIRDYQLLDSAGAPCVRSSSSWVLMDTTSRSLVRGARLEPVASLAPQSTDAAITEPCEKIVLPAGGSELQKVGEHLVVYSDLDYNGHVNNAKYIVWALDCLPLELVSGNSVREIAINYNKEARPGETVELLHSRDGNIHFVEGRGTAGQVFIVKILF